MSSLPSIADDWKQVKAFVGAVNSDLDACRVPSIPTILQEMLITGEDHRFFSHPGYDVRALLRATYRTMIGHTEGGSTIAQQLARIATGCFERTLRRKFREIQLAARITREFPKARIPAIYLLVAYYGWRMNGLRQAYQRLGYSQSSLSATQAASLIARLKYPEPRNAPAKRQQQIERRTRHIFRLHNTFHNRFRNQGLDAFN